MSHRAVALESLLMPPRFLSSPSASQARGLTHWETLSELMAPDIVEGLRSSPFLDAFPDVRIIDEDILVDGDKVIKRSVNVGTHMGPYAGLAATGRRVSIPCISIDRIENGKVVESWMVWDELGLLRQLGVEKVPA